MNTMYKTDNATNRFFRRNTNGRKWGGEHKKPINYHICVWDEKSKRWISCGAYTYLENARKHRDNLTELNAGMNYVIIGNYGQF